MCEIPFQQLIDIQLEILEKINDFCANKNIRYGLAYGTLLGAIRHKGYIPWDDDIDIYMPRPDYDRFLKEFPGSVEHLYVIAPELNIHNYVGYANVCDDRTILIEKKISHLNNEIGVKIDIFPIEGVPSDVKLRTTLINDAHRYIHDNYYKILYLKGFYDKGLPSVLKACAHKIIGLKHSFVFNQQKLLEIKRSIPYDASEYVIDYFDTSDLDMYSGMPQIWFEEYIDAPFENIIVKIPKEYHNILRHIYGNYMQLPPEEARVPHHDFEAFWK